ncbi:S24 family peptidase [Sphingomonas bacterium]|uniref:S24 family peptidase n=1 Tax=Sphingomonas bacterium TaxID=1895847 RepID=UPI001575307A|nr:helix-turn-helix transcriptional regulator [Sphingomonas bacterium]
MDEIDGNRQGDEGVRTALETLIRDRREDYAGLSRLLGRNAAYIQQFVKRGTPRRLSEEDRATLARYFRVSEAVFGGKAETPATIVPSTAPPAALRDASHVALPRFAVGASAGPGSLDPSEARRADIAFPPRMLRELGAHDLGALSLITVAGDSMRPTLADGDEILVDTSDTADRLRDGIYVLRIEEALLVKRIALAPSGGIAIRSDNPDHPSWNDQDKATLTIVGRVLWAGRKL